MTDNTQPEVGSTHIIRYALELGLLWIDGDGRDKVREALDALDAIEAKRISSGAGGVQALSAAPAGWKLVPEDATEEMVRATDKVNFANADTDGTIHNVWNVMLAASPTPTPTPPAEQPPRWVERWHGSGGKEFWEGWSILNAANREMIAHLGPDVDPDAVRDIVAAHNEALCGECAGTGGRWCPACAGATPPAEQPDTAEAALGGVYAELPAPNLPRGGFPDLFTEGQMRDFADRTHALRMEQAAPKAAPAPERSPLGAPAGHSGVNNTPQLLPCPFCGAPAHGYAIAPHSHSPAVLRLVPELPDHPGCYVIEGQCACGSGLIGANESEVTARWNRRTPQQEAQEPATVPYQKLTNEIDLILSDTDTELSIGAKRALLWMRTWVSVPLYTAPQPAPAPRSDDVVRDAARYRRLREHEGADGLIRSDCRGLYLPQRDALDSAVDALLFTTPSQRGEIAGDGKPCNNEHDPDCRWPDCRCRERERMAAAIDAAPAAQGGQDAG